MAQETYALHDKDTASLKNRWAEKFRLWRHARRERNERKRLLKGLLAYDERTLEDFGLTRRELILELGHDPYALPGLYLWRARGIPHL